MDLVKPCLRPIEKSYPSSSNLLTKCLLGVCSCFAIQLTPHRCFPNLRYVKRMCRAGVGGRECLQPCACSSGACWSWHTWASIKGNIVFSASWGKHGPSLTDGRTTISVWFPVSANQNFGCWVPSRWNSCGSDNNYFQMPAIHMHPFKHWVWPAFQEPASLVRIGIWLQGQCRLAAWHDFGFDLNKLSTIIDFGGSWLLRLSNLSVFAKSLSRFLLICADANLILYSG